MKLINCRFEILITKTLCWWQIDGFQEKKLELPFWAKQRQVSKQVETCFLDAFRQWINTSRKMAAIIHLTSAVCLSALSVTTVTSNLLLLVAIWKDPLKCFTAPTTSFIVVISLADLLTALTTEPFFAVYYFVVYFQGIEAVSSVLNKLFAAGSIISTVAISYSFLIVLALSWSQYVAMKCPHNFKRIVTQRNSLIVILLSLIYLMCFTSLQFTGMDKSVFLKLSLAINTTFLSVNLMVILLLLNIEFRRHLRRGRSFEVPAGSPSSAPNSVPKRKSRRENLQQQFTAVAMYLAAILLLSALPHVITAQVFLYSQSNLSPPAIQNFEIALRISDLLLFLKVCLDTFVYAWRLPTYRRTIKMLFFRRDICGILCLDDNQTGNSTSSELSHI